MLYNYATTLDCKLKNNYKMASKHIGLYQQNRSDKLKIDAESKLFNGKIGNVMTSMNKHHDEPLRTRVFPGAPYKRSNLYNLDKILILN